VQFAVALWVVALILTVAGLVCALRARAILSSIFIVTGLVLGLVSATYLD
jgi:hypothetical protein